MFRVVTSMKVVNKIIPNYFKDSLIFNFLYFEVIFHTALLNKNIIPTQSRMNKGLKNSEREREGNDGEDFYLKNIKRNFCHDLLI